MYPVRLRYTAAKKRTGWAVISNLTSAPRHQLHHLAMEPTGRNRNREPTNISI